MEMFQKEMLDSFVDSHMEEMWDIALYIHKNPELGYEEHKACKAQCDYLEAQGFQVQRGVEELDTAYVAVYGEGSPVIGIASEYDALKNLGHGCGHNLICTSSILTAAAVKEYLKTHSGTVKVIGTPAEEGGGGKIRLLEKGVFDDVDAVFMMHPTSDKSRLAGACMSSRGVKVTFHGISAHAGSHPDRGRNALSAASLYLSAIGFWQQHFEEDMRVSHIMTEGGAQPGMIPDRVCLSGSLRSFSLKNLNKLEDIVKECAQGCAQAMECTAEVEITEGYLGRIPNKTLSDVCRQELEALGEPLLDGMPSDFGGEDLGNVSYQIPICNPYITIFPEYKISGHTEQFKELACSSAGYRCIQVTAKAMARSITDLFENPELLREAGEELKNRLKKEQ